MEKRWVPIAYYYTGPLAKVKPLKELPHPLGYIPNYLKKKVAEPVKTLV